MVSGSRRAWWPIALTIAGCAQLIGVDDWDGSGGADTGGAAGASSTATGLSATTSSSAASASTTGGGGAGGCDVDCLGGDCVAGKCGPVLLAIGSGNMRHLAVDATGVYFTRGGGVVRVPTSATDTTIPVVIVKVTNADYLVLDGEDVYWTVFDSPNGAVRKQSKAGPPIVDIATPENYPIGPTLLGGMVYWLSYDGTLRRAPAAGGGPVQELGSTGYHSFNLATDGMDLWWTFKGASPDAGAPVGGVRKKGPPQLDIALGQPGPTGLSVDATSVYWFGDDASVHAAPKGGGAIVEIGPAETAVGTLFAGDVVVDTTHVYWTGLDTCSTMSCPKILRATKAGGAPEIFAQGDWGAVNGMAVSGGALYWTTGDERLFRQATGSP